MSNAAPHLFDRLKPGTRRHRSLAGFSFDTTPGEVCYVQIKPYGTAGGYRLTLQ